MQANKSQVQIERRAMRTPVSGTDKPKVDRPVQRTDLLQRVGTRDLARLASQLSTLLHAGMPLVPALSALAEQLQEPTGTPKSTLGSFSIAPGKDRRADP